MQLLSGAVLLSSLAIAAFAAPLQPTQRSATASTCNGRPELCSRSYGNTTFVGSHDSYAFSDDPLALARDQEVDVPTQLKLGVRLLQAQSHLKDGVIHFCHTSCSLFDGGPVVDYLNTVKTFLDANPNEVFTFIFTNPEGLSVKDVWEPAFTASGIDQLAFVPPSLPTSQSQWPTLGEMIDSGKRVVVFLDSGADTNSVPYILDEFSMIWETPFSVTDSSFPCKVDRTAGPLPDAQHMYMINHSLNTNVFGSGVIIPDFAHASRTNSVTSILANAYGCTQFAAGKAPNFVLLDWVDIGQAFQAANILNGFA